MKKRVFSHFFHRYPQNLYHFRDQQVIPHRMTYFSSAKYLYQISTPRNGRYRNPAEKRKWNISGHRSDLPPIGNSRTKYWKIDQKTHPRGRPYHCISLKLHCFTELFRMRKQTLSKSSRNRFLGSKEEDYCFGPYRSDVIVVGYGSWCVLLIFCTKTKTREFPMIKRSPST